MKKMLILMLVVMLCVTAAACSGSQDNAKTESTATVDSAAQGNEPEDLVVSQTYYNVYAYDEDNPNQKSEDTVTTYEYEFDSESRPIKTTAKTDGSVEYIKETEYDSAGNAVKQTVFDADGNKASVFEYTYDNKNNNNKTKFDIYNADGNLRSEITYVYDENGYLISESLKSDDYSYTIKHENDESGKEISSVQYDQNGAELMKIEFEYDSDGRLIRKNQSSNLNAGTPELLKVEFEYDDRGNAVKEVCTNTDGTILYSYDRVFKTVKELSGK